MARNIDQQGIQIVTKWQTICCKLKLFLFNKLKEAFLNIPEWKFNLPNSSETKQFGCVMNSEMRISATQSISKWGTGFPVELFR
jgi:hypothetical protein